MTIIRKLRRLFGPPRFIRYEGGELDRFGRRWGVVRRWRGWEPDSLYRSRILETMAREGMGLLYPRTSCAVCAAELLNYEAGPACRRCGGP